jgi:hypothetical protein
MYAFIIRNQNSINVAEQIIQMEQLDCCIAVRSELAASDEEYAKKIFFEKNQNYWEKTCVINESRTFHDFNHSIPSDKLSKFKHYIKNIKIISRAYNGVIEFLSSNSVEVLYLCNPLHSSYEQIVYSAARNMGIKVAYYQIGLQEAYFTSLQNSNFFGLIYKVIMVILFPHIYLKFMFPKLLHFDLAFLFFPKIKPFFLATTIKPIFLKQDKQIINKINNLAPDLKTLILWRPNVKDRKMDSLKDKILFDRVIKLFPNAYVKFHPRNTDDEVNYYTRNNKFKLLPFELSNLSAESIIINSSIENLIGFYTMAIFNPGLSKNANIFVIMGSDFSSLSHFDRQFYRFLTTNFGSKVSFL